MSAPHFHPRYSGLNLVKRLSHCYCHKLTKATKPSLVERVLIALIPHFDIVKTIEVDGVKQTVLYLRRFYVFRSKWFGLNFGDIYLHHIVRSDDDPDPHDHPWGFVGLVLKTGYTDESYRWITSGSTPTMKVWAINPDFTLKAVPPGGIRVGPFLEDVKPFRIIRREATHIHRVVTKGKPAWTLIFTSAYGRDWNFVTPSGPVFWRKYLGILDSTDYGE